MLPSVSCAEEKLVTLLVGTPSARQTTRNRTWFVNCFLLTVNGLEKETLSDYNT